MFSACPFKDVEISHIKGNIDKSDTKIKTECIEIFLIKFFIKADTYSFRKIKYLPMKTPLQ